MSSPTPESSTLPPQFDIPVHPSCVEMTPEIKELGLAKIRECRELLSAGKRNPKLNRTGIADAYIRMAGGGDAIEYKAILRQLKQEQVA